MNSKVLALALSMASLVLCGTVRAEGGGEESHALVPSAAAENGRPEEKSCKFMTELQREVGHTEEELKATRLFIAATILANKHAAVRDTPAMQEIQVGDGKYTAAIRALMLWHDSYTRSGGSSSDPDSATSGGLVVATIPPALVGIAGTSTFSTQAPKGVKTGHVKVGLSSSSVAALSAAGIYGGRSFGVEALKRSGDELPIGQAKMIKDSIDEGITAPVKFLGETLKWTPAQEAQFSRAVQKKTVETLIKSVNGMERNYKATGGDESLRIPIEPKIVASLASIDFLDIVEIERLGTPEEVASLRLIKSLFDRGSSVTDELTQSKAKTALTSDKSADDNMVSIARLHNLLKKVEAQLPPDSVAMQDTKALVEQSAKTIETLKKLCDLGVE